MYDPLERQTARFGGPFGSARDRRFGRKAANTVLGVWIALSLMWFAIDMPDDSSSIWFYWPMLGTGIGVAINGIVLLGIGGLFGVDWERREIEKYQRRRRGEPGG